MKVQAPTCHSYVGLYINNAAFHFQKWTINDLWPITTLPSQLPVCLISRDRHAPPHCCTHAFPYSGQATKAFLHLTWNMQASLFEPLSFYTASLILFFFSFPPSALHVLVHLVNHAGQLPTGFIGLVSYSPEIFQGRFIHHQPSLDWPGLSKDAREPHTITQSEAINSQSKMLHHWICASDGMLWQAVYTGVGSGGASKQETREKLFVRQEFTKHLLCERRWR